MMWHRPWMVVGLIAALSIFSACAETPVLTENWGKSYEAQKSSQIINPEAGKNLEPVAGLNGRVAVDVLENYEKRVKAGAEKRPSQAATIFTIGTSR